MGRLRVSDLLFRMRELADSNISPETGCNVDRVLCKQTPTSLWFTNSIHHYLSSYLFFTIGRLVLILSDKFVCRRCYSAARVDGRSYVSTINYPDSSRKIMTL